MNGTILSNAGNAKPMTNTVNASTDAELEQMLSKQRATIKVVGTGGAGNNTVTRIAEVGVTGTEVIAVNTDAQDLLYTNADKKILVGKNLTSGLGAGSDPKTGEEAARESERELKDFLTGADMVFITCGLGGGTGTGSAPVIADVAKRSGALTVGIVTLPFTMEGNRRYENALTGLEKLESIVDTLISHPKRQTPRTSPPTLPLMTAFKVADEILTNAVKGIAEMVTKAGLINLDFADIKAVMGGGGVALIGVGESDSENRAVEAVEKAITNPLLDVDVSGANGALINVSGGLRHDTRRSKKSSRNRKPKTRRKRQSHMGRRKSTKHLNKMIRTMLIVTGVKSSQIFGGERLHATERKREIESELGIELRRLTLPLLTLAKNVLRTPEPATIPNFFNLNRNPKPSNHSPNPSLR